MVKAVRVENGKIMLDLGDKSIELAWVTGLEDREASKEAGKKGSSQENGKKN